MAYTDPVNFDKYYSDLGFDAKGVNKEDIRTLAFAQNSDKIDLPALEALSSLMYKYTYLPATEWGRIAQEATTQSDKAKYIKQSGTNISSLNEQYKTESEIKAKEEELKTEEATKEQKITTDTASARTNVSNLIDSLGIDFDETTKNEAIDYFSSEMGKGNLSGYQVRSLLMQSPEYQAKQAEIEKKSAEEEATATRQQLGQELEKGTTRYLSQTVAPTLGRQFQSLGGQNRASLTAATSRAMRDIGTQRESILSQSALETAAKQSDYNRQDYVSQMVNTYNQAMQNYNQLYQQNAIERNQAIQKYWYPIQQQAIRQQNLEQSKNITNQQNWQQYLLNMQRSYAKEDQDYYSSLQKEQNWWNLGGNLSGAALGALLGGI